MKDALLFLWTEQFKVSLLLSYQKHLERLRSGLCPYQALDLATSEKNQTPFVGNARENSTVDHYRCGFEMHTVIVSSVCPQIPKKDLAFIISFLLSSLLIADCQLHLQNSKDIQPGHY